MPTSDFLEKVRDRAQKALDAARKPDATEAEILRGYRRFLRDEELRIKLKHRSGEDGVKVGQLRAGVMDALIHSLYRLARTGHTGPDGLKAKAPLTLVATGGYGRGILNPGSDVDILFLIPGKISRPLPAAADALFQRLFYLLTDIKIKVSPVTRTVAECVELSQTDNETQTSLLELRFLKGDETLFEKLQTEFEKKCLKGHAAQYLEMRRRDVDQRHQRYSNTVYLQEPNIKHGCGGLRDYQNVLWVSRVKAGVRSVAELAKKKIISTIAARELDRAYDFLHRVRNELHYVEKRPADVLTLRLQGRVATNLRYSQKRLIPRIDAFMRDYYQHTRIIHQHAESVMEVFQLDIAEEKTAGPLSFLARRKETEEKFDGFVAKNGLLWLENDKVFKDKPDALLALFQHAQVRHLELSPTLRQAIKKNWDAINVAFRYRTTNREVFESILGRKGDVARILRLMHRTGVLGRYFPEFGALTDLVQHEFFHRYTADEHTLRVVEQMDHLIDQPPMTPAGRLLHDLFQTLEDPYVIYLAILLHDSGRAANTQHHDYESAILADRVAKRLQLTIDRRRRLLFLVEHHLTLWRTATQKNIEDPAVIEEFCAIVRSQAWLDALFLLTVADSKGTNEASFSGFKESLLLQLYRIASAHLRGQVPVNPADDPEFRAEVERKLGESWKAEVLAHFAAMPPRYFLHRSAHRVASQLRLFREFFKQQKNPDPARRAVPVHRWRTVPERACSELTFVTKDQPMLLARVASCLAANKLNILSADFFLRADGVVFDVFRVCTTNFEPIKNEALLARFETLLTEAFPPEKIDPESWQPQRSAPETEDPEFAQMRAEFPTRVIISNDQSPQYTVAEVDAVDRLGLLADLFYEIAVRGCEVTHSRINTEKGAAMDTFYLTDAQGQKITDREQLTNLREALWKVCR
jgi:[protein-PII] uridylyltransferase